MINLAERQGMLLQRVFSVAMLENIELAHAKIARREPRESGRAEDALDDLLKLGAPSLEHCGIKVGRLRDELPVANIDRHKLTQILMNPLRNAEVALTGDQVPDERLKALNEDHTQIEAADNAVGIPADNLTRICAHGFGTKEDGHGCVLHRGAAAAME